MCHRILNISESTSLALHAARTVVRSATPLSAEAIAIEMDISRHHLSKVLRKMVEADVISVHKGPNGGFFFTEEQKKRPLMDVYTASGNHFSECAECMFEKSRCEKKDCLFGNLLKKVNAEFFSYFSKTKISDLTSKQNKSNKR